MSQPRNLGYPSVKAITQFLPIQKRRQLVKNVPSLRKVNQKIPFSFKKVVLSSDGDVATVKLDNLIWKFETEIYQLTRIETPGFVVVKRNQSIAFVTRMIKFYLGRKNLRVEHFDARQMNLSPNTINFSVIGSLQLNIFWLLDVKKQLQNFKNSKIHSLNLIIKRNETDYCAEILSFQCNEIKIDAFSETPMDFYEKLSCKKQIIGDDWTDEQKFRGMCKKFSSGQLEAGSSYRAGFLGNTEELFNRLREDFNVKTSSKTFFAVELKTPNLEMQVESLEVSFFNPPHSILKVRIVKTRTPDYLVNRFLLYADVNSFRNFYNLNKPLFFYLLFITLFTMPLLLHNTSSSWLSKLLLGLRIGTSYSLAEFIATIYTQIHYILRREEVSQQFKNTAKKLLAGMVIVHFVVSVVLEVGLYLFL